MKKKYLMFSNLSVMPVFVEVSIDNQMIFDKDSVVIIEIHAINQVNLEMIDVL